MFLQKISVSTHLLQICYRSRKRIKSNPFYQFYWNSSRRLRHSLETRQALIKLQHWLNPIIADQVGDHHLLVQNRELLTDTILDASRERHKIIGVSFGTFFRKKAIRVEDFRVFEDVMVFVEDEWGDGDVGAGGYRVAVWNFSIFVRF